VAPPGSRCEKSCVYVGRHKSVTAVVNDRRRADLGVTTALLNYTRQCRNVTAVSWHETSNKLAWLWLSCAKLADNVGRSGAVRSKRLLVVIPEESQRSPPQDTRSRDNKQSSCPRDAKRTLFDVCRRDRGCVTGCHLEELVRYAALCNIIVDRRCSCRRLYVTEWDDGNFTSNTWVLTNSKIMCDNLRYSFKLIYVAPIDKTLRGR